ncbi:MAG: HAMP domain-containing protein [Hyphomicrobium sp.]|uniref:ATP-binding protein n=1 Tax=Hyphomicrobium sp. TaxID=82 RepID=UPI0025BA96F0|nr:ATP-binding protein [Hyphomicrobium sp.]MBZ0208989.1 HAMP domain-containing protein [Hyphomicrobium sp.]
MSQAFDTVKGRVIIILLVFLSLSHLMGLWLYAQRSDVTTGLLHDALLADCIASISKLAESTPIEKRASVLALVSGPLLRFSVSSTASSSNASLGQSQQEGTRLHFFEHMLSAFLGRELLEGIRVAYFEESVASSKGLLATMNSSAHTQIDHIPEVPLAEINPQGTVVTEVRLADGTWMTATAPLLSVTPFSFWKTGAALGAMLTSVLVVAAWVLQRWTQPLTYFAAAAERLGTDIHSPPLSENGPLEVRTAAKAFNRMQDRVRRLVEDRIALAAAIAHDLGTPITRLRLRAEEIGDAEIREPILQDLQQMRRMVSATLGFARLDFTAEPTEMLDVMSLVQRVADDLSDAGAEVAVNGPKRLPVRSKPVAVQRALTNIVENAVKYGNRARINVTERAGGVEITVDDEGPGIPEALQAEIFEPFRRLPHSTGEATEGTGLGLTVARSLIRGLGGDITVANRAAGGLRVTISLPSFGETHLREWAAQIS